MVSHIGVSIGSIVIKNLVMRGLMRFIKHPPPPFSDGSYAPADKTNCKISQFTSA